MSYTARTPEWHIFSMDTYPRHMLSIFAYVELLIYRKNSFLFCLFIVFQFCLFLKVQHATFTITQIALGFNCIDSIHNKTDSQINAHPLDIKWSKFYICQTLYMPINWINAITCKNNLFFFFPNG